MEQERRSARRDDGDISARLTYFLIGTTVGAIVALLFAPKAGRELRGDIADATRKGIDRTRETAGQIGVRAGEYYEVARDRAVEAYTSATEAAREVAARKGEQISAAIEAGKQAYVEEKRRTESPAAAVGGALEAPPAEG